MILTQKGTATACFGRRWRTATVYVRDGRMVDVETSWDRATEHHEAQGVREACIDLVNQAYRRAVEADRAARGAS